VWNSCSTYCHPCHCVLLNESLAIETVLPYDALSAEHGNADVVYLSVSCCAVVILYRFGYFTSNEIHNQKLQYW